MVEHARRAAEVDADRVKVQFGPEVIRGLKELDYAVHGKKDFNDDVRCLLQGLASGKAVAIDDALTRLVMITEAAMDYIHKTGDREAQGALGEIRGHLIGQSKDAKPVTVLVEPKQRLR